MTSRRTSAAFGMAGGALIITFAASCAAPHHRQSTFAFVEPVPEPAAAAPLVAPGLYRLMDVTSTKCLGVLAEARESQWQVMASKCHPQRTQVWRIARSGDDFVVTSAFNGKCLEFLGGLHGKDANLWQDDCRGTANQAWSVRALPDGNYDLRSRSTDACADAGPPPEYVSIHDPPPCLGDSPHAWVLIHVDE